jgi:hypothetical protein
MVNSQVSQTLLEIEQSIRALTESEQLWLMERIVHQLRSKSQGLDASTLESQLTEMATDPEIQTEINAINREFLVTELDGLESA